MPTGLDEGTHRRLLDQARQEGVITKRQAEVYSLHVWGDGQRQSYTLFRLSKKMGVSLSTVEKDHRRTLLVMQERIRLHHEQEAQKPVAPSGFANTDEEEDAFQKFVHSGGNVWGVEDMTPRQLIQPRVQELPQVMREELGGKAA